MTSRRSSGIVLCLLAPAVGLFACQAAAEWHANVKLLSDYLYRGYSKSRGNPVAQAGLNYSAESGWYAGLGLSQARFDDRLNPDRAELELTPQLGWTVPVTGAWRADLSVLGYVFDNKVFGLTSDYAELAAGLHYRDWFSAKASFAPNAYNRSVEIFNYETIARYDIRDDLQVSAGLGFHQAGALLGKDYFFWNAGLTWHLSANLAVDLRYVDVALQDEQHADAHYDDFYPRVQENKFLFAVALGF